MTERRDLAGELYTNAATLTDVASAANSGPHVPADTERAQPALISDR